MVKNITNTALAGEELAETLAMLLKSAKHQPECSPDGCECVITNLSEALDTHARMKKID